MLVGTAGLQERAANRLSTASFISGGGAKEFAQKHSEKEEKMAISEGRVPGSVFNSG